jgi:hypothetical protein
MAIFPYIPGSHSEAFRGVSVFLGVLFSLGSAGAVSNAIAGIILTYMRPFQLGDRVKIADTVGDVTEKTLLVTRIRTIKNVDITIPNSLILGAHIINYSSTSLTAPPLILNTSDHRLRRPRGGPSMSCSRKPRWPPEIFSRTRSRSCCRQRSTTFMSSTS